MQFVEGYWLSDVILLSFWDDFITVSLEILFKFKLSNGLIKVIHSDLSVIGWDSLEKENMEIMINLVSALWRSREHHLSVLVQVFQSEEILFCWWIVLSNAF